MRDPNNPEPICDKLIRVSVQSANLGPRFQHIDIVHLLKLVHCSPVLRRGRGGPLLVERGGINGAERGEVSIPAGYPAKGSPLLAEQGPLDDVLFPIHVRIIFHLVDFSRHLKTEESD